MSRQSGKHGIRRMVRTRGKALIAQWLRSMRWRSNPGRTAHPYLPELLEPRQLLAGNAVISEIMYHPGYGEVGDTSYVAEDTRQEYLELFNPGDTAINLKDWQITQGVSFVFPDVTLPAGGYLVVAANVDAFKAKYPQVTNVVGGWQGQLGNNGEDIELQNSQGQRVDFLSYATEGDWAIRRRVVDKAYPSGIQGWAWITGADAGNKSLELINPAVSNEFGQNWSASLVDQGTPGRPNSVAASNLAPIVLDVKHLPVIPKSTDPVTITAKVTDEQAAGLIVSLYHRLDGQPTFTAQPMYDDGRHGDGAAGDGVYGITLPPQADRTIVEFYVQATDAAGQVRSWPAPSDDSGAEHAANALYQVDDTVYSGDQPIYRFIIPQAEWDAWSAQMSKGHPADYSDALMNATFVAIDGVSSEVRYSVGVRNRGEGTRSRVPHNLQIKIPQDRPWHGITTVSLNTQFTWSQVAGNAIFALAGLPAPYGKPVQVRVNGVNHAKATSPQYGSYFQFEPYGREWAEAHLPEDSNGNIYKGVLAGPADLRYIDDNPNSYRRGYIKQTNTSADDWSDLVELVRVLNTTPDDQYTQEVSRVVNVDEWLKYFVVNSLIGNRENSLGGVGSYGRLIGDDYSMYRGVEDPRFQLLIHDLDTVLGQGDYNPGFTERLFPTSSSIATLDRLLKWKDFAPRYFQIFKEQIETTFSPQRINPLLDQMLGGWVPDNVIQSMKDYAASRAAYVLSQIPQTLTAATSLPQQGGYAYTTGNTAALTGKADAIRTRRVLVNGVEAAYTAWTGTWTIDNVNLPRAGINRVFVQTLDENGNAFASTYVDIWRDTGKMTSVSGKLAAGTTTWTLAQSPYRVTADITVPVGSTLVIEPGVTVFFDAGTVLKVQSGGPGVQDGRLVAEGAEQARIHFTRTPGATGNWDGFDFAPESTSTAAKPTIGARADNRIAYADIDYADAADHAIKATNSRIYLDHLVFGNHNAMYVDVRDSAMVLNNSILPSITSDELVHVWETDFQFPADGYAIFDGNWFGRSGGYNDIIDITGGQRPGPIAIFTNNVFTGGGDDAIDMDSTDAYIAGNVFMHFHQDAPRESQSHGVTTGNESALTSQITVVGNLFYDMDHGVLVKDGGSATIVNNTFVNIHNKIPQATSAAINLYEVRSGQWQGDFVYVDGNIFHDISRMFENADWAGHKVSITVANSIFPDLPLAAGESWTSLNNLHVDPMLRNTAKVTDPRIDFQLMPGSPAIGRGPNGRDMGGLVPIGASISGEPSPLTWHTDATLTVGGPDIYGFKYRINAGPWSNEMGVMKSVTSITRNGLIGTVTLPNHGYADGDIVDIYGAAQAEYSGTFTISNVTANTFNITLRTPPATNATGVITVKRRETIQLTNLPSGTYTVYILAKNSAGLWQSETLATASRTWTVDTSLAPRVRINEVLAHNTKILHGTSAPDLVELYNDGAGPIDLSGMSLTDNPALPGKFVFPAGTTLTAGQYLVLYADSATTPGEFHLGFSLKNDGDDLYLYGAPSGTTRTLIDSIEFGLQLPDHSVGRLPDGNWGLTQPTFGSANLAQITGDPRALKINEWLTDGQVLFAEDFIELHNPQSLPVPLSGLYLTDNPVDLPNLRQTAPDLFASCRIPALSFIAPNGFAVLLADSNPSAGADHLGFKLSPQQGMIGLFDRELGLIDQVIYGSQKTDRSQGRGPDGSSNLNVYSLPTPGVTNPGMTTITTETITPFFDIANAIRKWRYHDRGIDLGTDWRQAAYDDSNWGQGSALLWYRATSQSLPEAINTTLAGDPNNLDSNKKPRPYRTYYFRTHFTFDGDPSKITSLTGRMILDDGAVLYLNGQEILRVGIDPNTTVAYSTAANRGVNTATYEDFSILLANLPAGTLRQGDNVLAVEVHQNSSSSSDVVWGTSLSARQAQTSTTIINPIPETITALENQLRITEIMYNPVGGGDYEYIELQNTGSAPLDLTGIRLSDGVDFVFPSMMLQPGQYVLVVANQTAFAYRYGTSLNVAGQYSGQLSNGGEDIVLQLPDPYDAAILRFSYDPTWHPPTNGTGHSLVIINPAQPQATWSDAAAWRASTLSGGSPGVADQSTASGSVVINEILAHTDASTVGDWIELHNTTSERIDIGGWYLSDDASNLTKYRIASNTFIPANGYIVFTQFGNFDTASDPGCLTPFGLSEHGDTVYLTSAGPDGTPGDYREAASFGASDREVTLGRYRKSTGEVAFIPMSQPSAFQTNAQPRVGPVVINELMYHPLTGNEYIELRNVTSNDVSLYDPLHPENTWKFTSGIAYTFPTNVTLPANGYLLVVPVEPALFRSQYSIPANVPIFGPYTGGLSNGGELIALSKPGDPEPAPLPLPYIQVDSVWYSDAAPWPTEPDGTGPSLARLQSNRFGDDVINWAAKLPTPGLPNVDSTLTLTGSATDTFHLRITDSTLEVFRNTQPGQAPPTQSIPLSNLTQLRLQGGQYTLASNLAGLQLSLESDSQVRLTSSQRLAGLSLSPNATLDLADHDLIVSNGSLAAISALIQRARGSDGTWAGAGLTSSSAKANKQTGLAVMLNHKNGQPILTTFGGQSVGVNDILVKYTWNGDVNLDGVVDAADYFLIDSGYITQEGQYRHGDLNLDGTVDASDYFLVDSAYIAQSGIMSVKKRSPVQELFSVRPLF